MDTDTEIQTLREAGIHDSVDVVDIDTFYALADRAARGSLVDEAIRITRQPFMTYCLGCYALNVALNPHTGMCAKCTVVPTDA